MSLEEIPSQAPSRADIAAIESREELFERLSEANDAVIAIETQLEFYTGNDARKGRRVAALIHWRCAVKNLKNRLNQLAGAKRIADAAREIDP